MRNLICFILLAVLLAACGGTPPTGLSELDLARTQVAIEATQTNIAKGAPSQTTNPDADISTSTSVTSTQSCSSAMSYLGQEITCVIEKAHCSYRPDIDGSPTFCNDAPYPNHDFTLLIWEQDWSDFDGDCILVTGLLTRYKGKLEIIAQSRSQIQRCK